MKNIKYIKRLTFLSIFVSMICVLGINMCHAGISDSEAILNPESYSALGPVQLLGFCLVLSLVITAYTMQQYFKAMKNLTDELKGRPCLWKDNIEFKK